MADSFDVVVVGAGAAGLVAAAEAAARGRRTLLLEKNARPGVKILMSGGTRCNITQNTDNRGIIAAYGPPGRFLHSALAALSVADTIRMFESEGVQIKVEETGKIFPVSDRAEDVLTALLRRANRAGAQLALEEPLEQIERVGDFYVLRTPKREIQTSAVILTTGGRSYPGSGTTGDGYAWAAQFGHTIVPPRPALTPITCAAEWPMRLKGLTIPDVGVRVLDPALEGKARVLAARRGSFLFTHFGLSGPVVLDVSRVVSGHSEPRRLVLECDFVPSTSEAALDESLKAEAARSGKKHVAIVLSQYVPRRLAESLIGLANVDVERRMAEVSRAERMKLVEWLKRAAIPVSGTRGFGKAEVTAGGVALNEVDSSTLESKLAPRLFFAGEILDLDGPIGGYNFQAAWSTGYLAGSKA